MSQIFDALHQSASEGAGHPVRGLAAARELLQVVERTTSPSALLMNPEPAPAVRVPLRQFPSAEVHLPPHSKFVCFGHSDSLAAEKFHFLATRLRHMQQKRSLKRLVVTSSVAGEGKSMVSANLACALAAAKQQVLLVEGDLRRPSIGQELGLGELPGLGQMLRNTGEGLNSVYRLNDPGLCLLLAGDAGSNPLEFMEPVKLADFMDRLSAGFDWVVIDSPPVLPLADTSLWMRLADAVLLITRPGVTAKRQLQRSLEAIEQSKLLGIVLNASQEATANHYYYHYSSQTGSAKKPKAAGQ